MPLFNMEGAVGQQVRREARPLWLDPPEVVQQQAASKAHLQQVRPPALECHWRRAATRRGTAASVWPLARLSGVLRHSSGLQSFLGH